MKCSIVRVEIYKNDLRYFLVFGFKIVGFGILLLLVLFDVLFLLFVLVVLCFCLCCLVCLKRFCFWVRFSRVFLVGVEWFGWLSLMEGDVCFLC